MNGMQGFLYKLLNEHTAESDKEDAEKEVKKMSDTITHAMILVTINQGYSDAVMNTARAAGATGGTILKGLRCSPGKSAVIFGITIQEEQEIVAIVVPKDKKTEIMQAISSAPHMASTLLHMELLFPCLWTELWDYNADSAIAIPLSLSVAKLLVFELYNRMHASRTFYLS